MSCRLHERGCVCVNAYHEVGPDDVDGANINIFVRSYCTGDSVDNSAVEDLALQDPHERVGRHLCVHSCTWGQWPRKYTCMRVCHVDRECLCTCSLCSCECCAYVSTLATKATASLAKHQHNRRYSLMAAAPTKFCAFTSKRG